MKDSKTIWLIVLSLLLVVASLTLLWTWGYRYGWDSARSSVVQNDSAVQMPQPLLQAEWDSLQQLRTETLTHLSELDSAIARVNGLQYELNDKISEFYRLRDEIASRLTQPTNNADLKEAKQKIARLQAQVNDLSRQKPTDLPDTPSKTASAVVPQPAEPAPMKPVVTPTPTTPVPTVTSDPVRPAIAKPQPSKPASGKASVVQDIRLIGQKEEDGRYVSTENSAEMERITGRFIYTPSQPSDTRGEIYVVVLQPNGSVLKSTSWDTGLFLTDEGKKLYSGKIRYDFSDGAGGDLDFMVTADQFPSGTYQFHFYRNGKVISRQSKVFF